MTFFNSCFCYFAWNLCDGTITSHEIYRSHLNFYEQLIILGRSFYYPFEMVTLGLKNVFQDRPQVSRFCTKTIVKQDHCRYDEGEKSKDHANLKERRFLYILLCLYFTSIAGAILSFFFIE